MAARKPKRPPVTFAIIGLAFIVVEQHGDSYHILADSKDTGIVCADPETAKERAIQLNDSLRARR